MLPIGLKLFASSNVLLSVCKLYGRAHTGGMPQNVKLALNFGGHHDLHLDTVKIDGCTAYRIGIDPTRDVLRRGALGSN